LDEVADLPQIGSGATPGIVAAVGRHARRHEDGQGDQTGEQGAATQVPGAHRILPRGEPRND
jgi:hypothetical protein